MKVAFKLLFLTLATGAACCAEKPKMVWTAEKEGFEQSYFREPNGPIYVRRKLGSDGCIFGDYPMDGVPTASRVGCGQTWRGTFGEELVCQCTDGGALADPRE